MTERLLSQTLSRRTFLTMAGVAPFAAPALAAMQKRVPVGLELYSVRGELVKDLEQGDAQRGLAGEQRQRG